MVPKLVGRSKLMEDPKHLVFMRNQIGWEFKADQEIDWCAHHLCQVDQATSQHVVQNFFRRIPFEWDGNNLGLMARRLQRRSQSFSVNFGTAPNKRDLNRGN